eukprot:scaffold115249_cov69-Phaeocystis_antarctica.AAC.2
MLPKTIADRKARLRRKTSSVSSIEEDVLEMYFTCVLELGVMPNGAVWTEASSSGSSWSTKSISLDMSRGKTTSLRLTARKSRTKQSTGLISTRNKTATTAETGRHAPLTRQQVMCRGHNRGHTSLSRARLSFGTNLVAATIMRGIPRPIIWPSNPDPREKTRAGSTSTAHAATQSWNDA